MSKNAVRDLTGKKSQYYVEYLGWRACRGLEGREFTEPIVQELLRKRHREPLPRLTIQVSRKDIKVSRDVSEEGKKKKIKTIKYPSIPSKDVTFAIQALEPDSDVVACIYLGFNPRTSSYVHTHVYRCDSPLTAKTFVTHLQQIIQLPDHQQRLDKIERDLVSRNAIDLPTSFESPRMPPAQKGPPNSEGYPRQGQENRNYATSTGSNERSPTGSDDMDADLVSLKDVMPFDSIADELKQRLNVGNGPILLPPADYDTIRRRGRETMDDVNERKSRNPIIVGAGGVGDAEGESRDSGDDRSPGSDRMDGAQFPSKEFYLYPPRSPRDPGSEPTSPRQVGQREQHIPTSPRVPRHIADERYDVQNSPRIPRRVSDGYNAPNSPRVPRYDPAPNSPRVATQHGRQQSSSSSHSRHSSGSGPHPSNGHYESRDRLSAYSKGSNSHRDLSFEDEPRADYGRGNVFNDEVYVRSNDGYGRGTNLTSSMPTDLLRREIPKDDYRDRDDVLLRNKDQYNRSQFATNSMPAEILRREMAAEVDRAYSQRLVGQPEYPDRFSPRKPDSSQYGDFRIRKANSMYR